jgi:lysophospholipase
MKMTHSFLFSLLLFLGINILPIAAQNEPSNSQFRITTEEQLTNPDYLKQIMEFYETGSGGLIEGKAGVPIYYKVFIQKNMEKGAILISSGRTEAALKYKEVIYDLYNNGYSVYIHDHRGQGLSGRMAEDSEMGYVDDFQYYIDDMKIFYDDVISAEKHNKIFLLSHSLGGAVAMSYIEQYPTDFIAAAFSSPMLGFDWYICPLAKILSGKTPKYAPGQGPYSDDSTKFESNSVTGSKERYYLKIAENNRAPESRLGGVSVQWLKESCKQIKTIFKNVEAIEIPVLIFTADNESVVNPKAYDKFYTKARRLEKECSIYPVNNAQHELLMEKDAARTEVLSEIFKFYGGR